MSTPLTLLLDLGNSRLKWAWLQGAGVGEVTALPHRGKAMGPSLDQAWQGLPRPERILLSSVAGSDRERQLQGWVERHWGRSVEPVHSSAQARGVSNAYPEPERLGVDRWLALIAVHSRYPGAACIVDCGSAITLDGLAPDGRHLGGLILPGLGLMREALLQGTQLAPSPKSVSPQWLARDTAGAVEFGGLYACVALVERLAQRIGQDCGRVPRVIVSGGDGASLRQLLEIESRYEPDLVLTGLAQIAGEIES